jgi:hypothetical protein
MTTRMTTFARAAGMLIRNAAAKGRQLIRRANHAAMESRRHRVQAEQEQFRGRYRLASKNDDDLPIVR